VNTVFKEYESARMECWFRHKWLKIEDFIPTV
jgi:hypothetical protein